MISAKRRCHPCTARVVVALLFWTCPVGGFAVGQSADAIIPVEIFDPGYLAGDSNYHSVTAASDGFVYFSMNSHHPNSSARLFRFDPSGESVELLGDVTEALGIDPLRQIPHGKIHTALVEHEGYLYFATHTSQYEGNLPDMSPSDGRLPYQGGHFMRYNLTSGAFEDLAHLQLPNEGIITMALDQENETLYGLTWPTGLLISYNLHEGLLHNWGAVQERGEWGQLPEEWDFINRKLAVDGAGSLYGSSDTGRIWHFELGQQRPVQYLAGLTLDAVPRYYEDNFMYANEPHFFWRNWRTILWNESTASFWGLHGGSTQLFEFDPNAGMLRSVASLRAGPETTQRNPYRTQLGLTLGPNNTLYYLAHGPPVEVEGRRNVQTSVYLLTYHIGTGQVTNHGALMGAGNRRVYFTESIAIGVDGHPYTVAWVETVDTERMAAVQAARGLAVPEETRDVIYEMQLVRLPPLKQFAE